MTYMWSLKKLNFKKKKGTMVVTWGWGLRESGQTYKLKTST